MKDSDEYRRAEFRRLWLMGYARESFRNIRIACEYIVDQRLDEFSSINHPLCIAIVVLYARPFGRSKIVGASGVGPDQRDCRQKLDKLPPYAPQQVGFHEVRSRSAKSL
jgi:hypothetical protein